MSQSSQSNSMRMHHQQLLRQHQCNIQSYLQGASASSQPLSNLKVKKSALKTTAGNPKAVMTPPQRVIKGKGPSSREVQEANAGSTSVVILSNGGKPSVKAQQYLRNSFMVKQLHQGA